MCFSGCSFNVADSGQIVGDIYAKQLDALSDFLFGNIDVVWDVFHRAS